VQVPPAEHEAAYYPVRDTPAMGRESRNELSGRPGRFNDQGSGFAPLRRACGAVAEAVSARRLPSE
jgi:hypothetical protein